VRRRRAGGSRSSRASVRSYLPRGVRLCYSLLSQPSSTAFSRLRLDKLRGLGPPMASVRSYLPHGVRFCYSLSSQPSSTYSLLAASAGRTSYNTYLSWRKVCCRIVVIEDSQVPRKLEGNMFAFTPWRKMKRKQRLSGGARSYE
jgi:hypothetical protein